MKPMTATHTLTSTHADSPLVMWKMLRNRNEARCLVNVGPHGLELEYVLNGWMLASYRFDRAEQVVAWAESKQVDLQAEGWKRA